MSNEELAAAIRAGERDKLMELWGQVRRLVHDMAYKRLRVINGAGGVALDDLTQAGFLGFLEAVRAYDPSAGLRFTSYLTYPVKLAFSEAEGRRSMPRGTAKGTFSNSRVKYRKKEPPASHTDSDTSG